MRVLITNLTLAHHSASEAAVELLADGLRRAGHSPMLLAMRLGPLADRLRARGHLVVDRLAALPARPDIIHAQHTPAALGALAAFPSAPAVFACHGAALAVEAPRLHPQIRQWIAADDLSLERCLSRGVPRDRVTIIPDAVDLQRFPRRPMLPHQPGRALMSGNHGHRALIREACAGQGFVLDEAGPLAGRGTERTAVELAAFDLVFATGRMALEAASIGCAVIVCDDLGFAGLLTHARLSAWRQLNFGAGLLTAPPTLESLRDAIAGYNPDDAAAVTVRLRAEATLDAWMARHLAVYDAALSDPEALDPQQQAASTAAWIEDLVPGGADRDWRTMARESLNLQAAPLVDRLEGLEARLREAILRHTAAEAARASAAQARADADAARAQVNAVQAEADAFRAQAIIAGRELDALHASTSWRITAPIRGLRTIFRRK